MRDIVAYCNGLSKAEFWSLGMGDVQNLLDEALEEIERLREGLRQARDCCARPADAEPVHSAESVRTEGTLAAALRPFGWICGAEFWAKYYNDPWVFNLANAVERLTEENARLQRLIDGSGSTDD